MTEVVNGHHAQPVLDTYRRAKESVASHLWTAVQHLEAARQITKAHALPQPIPASAEITNALFEINKDLTNTENQP